MRYLLPLLFIATAVIADKQVSYENYKVFKMMVKTEEELRFIQHLVESRDGYQYWSGLSSTLPTSIMVAAKDLNFFIKQMDASHIKYEKIIDNVQELIDRQKAGIGNEPSFGWKSYHPLEEIYNWLDSLEEKYPGQAETIFAGYSSHGRELKGIKLSFKENNPGVFIESGIHAYEWITPATATYLINEFLTSEQPSVRKLAESYDWYIFPTFNPDGYEYSHTTDRMWKKSRSYTKPGCIGTDLNRNWDFKWKTVGASSDPCDSKFAGVAPFTEYETLNMSKYIKSIGDKLFAYISFHSFTQLLMVPYGYTTEHLDNYNETYAIGIKTAEALSKRYGTQYTVGNLAETLYPASGTSSDWVKATLKLPIVFSFELRDKGDYGMLLPPEQIIPNGEEVLDGLITLFEESKKYGYPKLH